jgi:hypothetical protein
VKDVKPYCHREFIQGVPKDWEERSNISTKQSFLIMKF